jgi:hypothetical protein
LKDRGKDLGLGLDIPLPSYLSKKNQRAIAAVTATISTCINITAGCFIFTLLFGGALQFFWGLVRGI